MNSTSQQSYNLTKSTVYLSYCYNNTKRKKRKIKIFLHKMDLKIGNILDSWKTVKNKASLCGSQALQVFLFAWQVVSSCFCFSLKIWKNFSTLFHFFSSYSHKDWLQQFGCIVAIHLYITVGNYCSYLLYHFPVWNNILDDLSSLPGKVITFIFSSECYY